jgi:hypothetical protein
MIKFLNFRRPKIAQLSFRHLLMIFFVTVLLISCEDDYESDAGDHAILLTYPGQQIKAPGRGQYKLRALSGEDVAVTASMASVKPLKTFTIMKTVNLASDQSFGDNGTLTVDLNSVNDEFLFNYKPTEEDVDQLVGFTFHAEGTNGSHLVSDLQLVVTLSPRDNLPRKNWLWKSKLWIDKDNLQDIKECEKDNYYLFNSDGSMSINFGANTGTPGCDFDGFNVYDTWSLSEDEKTFTMVYHSIFSPDVPQTEIYRVKTLTTEMLELEIDFDLTWAGEGAEETFLYEFTALPK